MKPEHLSPTKAEMAQALPVGTWFVHPGPLPQRHTAYRPKLYQVLTNHRIGPAMHEEFALWTQTKGANSPRAAYRRISAIAAALNGLRADAVAAQVYLETLRQAGMDAAVTHVPGRHSR